MKTVITICIMFFCITLSLGVNASSLLQLPTDPNDCVVQYLQPVYPKAALCDGVKGTVTLLVSVNTNGEIGDIIISQSSNDSILDTNALSTIELGWKFKPYPYNYTVSINIEYKSGNSKVTLNELVFHKNVGSTNIDPSDLKAYKDLYFKESLEQVREKIIADTEIQYKEGSYIEGIGRILGKMNILEHDFYLILDFYQNQLYRVALHSFEYSSEIDNLLTKIITNKYETPTKINITHLGISWHYAWGEEQVKAEKNIQIGSSKSFNALWIEYSPIVKLIMKADYIKKKQVDQEYYDNIKAESEKF